MTFPPLPASREEAEQVGALWRRLAAGADAAAGNATVLTAARADEAAFKRAGPGHRVLHLATHGFFLGTDCDAGPGTTRAVTPKPASQAAAQARPRIPDNPLLQSGLALAGANRRFTALAGAEDGILTAQEVAALDLEGVEWAVLSACDTGLGAIRAGEGVFGLRRAFRIAGARTIIMSLWPVEDRAARDWMRTLYQGRLLERRSTEDAVREASRRVLDQRRRQGASTHPFFWAGFVASGDWR
jgi:CHAT domain-containing protein